MTRGGSPWSRGFQFAVKGGLFSFIGCRLGGGSPVAGAAGGHGSEVDECRVPGAPSVGAGLWPGRAPGARQ